MSEKLAYLGWGIIGTPKGRQEVGDGADKQLWLAKNFDLPQEFGGCLPDPKQDPNFSEVLYYLSLQMAEKHSVLGLAEYRPAYEQEHNRAGSYFGSFIEAVSCSFSENNLSTLFAALFKLSQFQYQAFIDPNTRKYKESINGKMIQSPHDDLVQIAEQIQPLAANLLSQTAAEETLFVQCGKGKVVEALKTLLNEQLYYRFKHIYFTDSDHISAQMQSKKIAKMHLSYLENGRFFTDSYRKEILYLHQQNGQYRTHLQKVEQNLAAEKANQAQLVSAQVQQQVEQYKQRAEQAEQSVADIRQSAAFGKQVFDLIQDNAASLNNPQLTALGGMEGVSNTQLANQLQQISGDLKTLMMRSRSVSMSPHEKPEADLQTIQKEPLNAVFAVLSGLLFTILLGIGVYSFVFSDDTPKVDPKMEQTLKEMQVKLKTAEDNLASKEEELKTQKTHSDSIDVQAEITKDRQAFIRLLCERNPKASSNMELPSEYNEGEKGAKLCPQK